MKTALIIYFSFEGNVRSIVSQIEEHFSIPSEALNPQIKLEQKSTLMTMLHGGKSALFKEKANLTALKYNPDDFDLIILAWPLWAWTFPPAMREFLDRYPLKNKQILLIVSSSSKAINKCVKEAKQILANNTIEGVFSFRDPLKRKEENLEETEKLMNRIGQLLEADRKD